MLINVHVWAQCHVISHPPTISLPCSTTAIGQLVIANSGYAPNITSLWIGANNLPLVSTGTSTSSVSLNCAGTYTVEFHDNLSNCTSSKTLSVAYLLGSRFDVYSYSPNRTFTLRSSPKAKLEIVNAFISNRTHKSMHTRGSMFVGSAFSISPPHLSQLATVEIITLCLKLLTLPALLLIFLYL